MIVKVKEPIKADLKLLRKEHLLFCYLHLAALPDAHRGPEEDRADRRGLRDRGRWTGARHCWRP